MSTWIYLQCVSHDPVITSDGESGQHLQDLVDVRYDIEHKEETIKNWVEWVNSDQPKVTESVFDHWFRNNTARFLHQHPKCELNILDEYGESHPIKEETNADKAAEQAVRPAGPSGSRPGV